MHLRLFFAISLLVLPFAALGQTQNDVPLDDLRTPPSPAFVLLNIAPTAVERPTTPRALGAAIISALNESNGPVPQNFSLEVAPYWLTPHPELKYEMFNDPSFLQSIKQTFSVSLATKAADDKEEAEEGEGVDDSSASGDEPARFGIGIRAAWLLGSPSQANKDAVDRLKSVLADAAASIPNDRNRSDDEEARLAEEAVEKAAGGKKYADLARAVGDTARQGRVVVDFAAAMSGRFENNDADDRRHEKTAFWITPAYRFDRALTNEAENRPATIDFVGVLRYLDDRTAAENGSAIDFGARFVWENDALAISAEHLRRTNSENDSERTAIVIEFKLSEDIYLTGTLGKDFDDSDEDDGNLLALFGLNFNFGKKPILTKQ